MHSRRLMLTSLVLPCLLAGCDAPADSTSPQAQTALRVDPQAATLLAGAAEDYLNLPIGVPLAAYTGRLALGNPGPDRRTSPYTTEFVPSAGAQSRIPARVIWLQNGGQNVVLVKVDIAYAFDGILFELYKTITDATGVDVTDKILLATSHSHSSYGDFSHDPALYLGSDQFNTEIFTRLVSQVTELARQAHDGLEPAAIGVGFDPSFDPIGVDQIFRDRRGENDNLVGTNGQILGPGYKDPRLTLIRVDRSQGTSTTSDDTPLALIHSFGIHGTIMGEDNPLTSVEAPGHVDLKVQERFNEEVVVMHIQGAAGDQSPAGSQDDFARMESIGERAAPKIVALRAATKTATGDIPVELITRSIAQDRDTMHIRRQGTADYYYTPFTQRYQGDDIVWDAAGKVISPIDEFNTEYGAALCSGDSSMIAVGMIFGWRSKVAPYNTCGNVDEILKIMDLPLFSFDLGWASMPLLTAQSAVISAIKLGPLPIYSTDGTSTTDSLVAGVFPGEPISLYSDVFRKEIQDKYGIKYGVTFGYAQDHEGYLLTLEDWLSGGYEPEINQWGPIQAEYLLEQAVELVGQLGTNNPALPASAIPHPDYEYFPLEPAVPDITADAGTVPARVPSYLYTFDGVMPLTPQPDAQVSRLTGLATFLWKGGDPAVDLPDITLERESTTTPGQFETVLHPSGRPWSNGGYEFILTYTPDPLADSGDQAHYWLATFQAVTAEPSLEHSAGLPTGRYRIRVDGQAYHGDPGAFPWPTQPYTLTSNPFTVAASSGLVVTPTVNGSALSFQVAYPGPERGYRLISLKAQNQHAPSPLNAGPNPTPSCTVAIYNASNIQIWQKSQVPLTTSTGASSASVTPPTLSAGTYSLVVWDVFGNFGKGTFTVN